jgi:hypothetical protein
MADYFSSTDDPIVYTAQGSAFHCSELIAMRGGWQNISAEDSAELSKLGCYPGPLVVGDQYYTGYTLGGSYDAAYDSSPQGGVTSVPPPITNAPINEPEQVFRGEPMPTMNVDPIMGLISTVPMQTGPMDWSGWIQGQVGNLLENFGRGGMWQVPGAPDVEAGITAGGCVRRPCKTNRRVKIAWDPTTQKPVLVPRNPKVVIGADGKPTVVWACPPKRMNPLNPHALRRAAVRLGRFHNIASTIEKMVQKACRTGIGRGRARGFSRASSCGPRKRCR